MLKPSFEIFSVFGQVDKVIAEDFIKKGFGRRIEPALIPDSALFNSTGQRAHFAIMLYRENVPAFREAIADLYA